MNEKGGKVIGQVDVDEQLKLIYASAKAHNLLAVAFMIVLGLFFGIVSELLIGLSVLSQVNAVLLIMSGLGIVFVLEVEFNRILKKALSLVPQPQPEEASEGGGANEEGD